MAKQSKGVSRRGGKGSDTQVVPDQSVLALKDEEIEKGLYTGEHEYVLREYFGELEYNDLRRLANEAQRMRATGATVYILPGIMGSTLGLARAGGLFNDIYWLDIADIVLGNLKHLALTSPIGKTMRALSVLHFVYQRLKLRLRRHGFNAQFFPFDWRQPLELEGARLKNELEKAAAGGSPAHLVAHSMGGLIARSAIHQGAPFERLIMLGTPNLGSFAPALVFRGQHSVAKWINRFDPYNSMDDYIEKVFTTFDGLIQMLPFRYAKLDLYSTANWPRDGKHPTARSLRDAPGAQVRLAEGDSRMTVIAGVNIPTVVDVALKDDKSEFLVIEERRGDGTVPLEFAMLPGAKTYYVQAEHGALPRRADVADAVADLLRGREPTAVAAEPPAPSRADGRVVLASQLFTPAQFSPAERPPTTTEVRFFLSEFASPVLPPTETAAEPGPGAPPALSFENTMISRSRMHRIEVSFAKGDITQADTRAVALGMYKDVTPGGPALAFDLHLRGAVSELVARRMFTGNVGEIHMMPTGRHPVSADYINFVGLGHFDDFATAAVETAMENLVRVLLGTWVEEVAVVLFGAGSGIATCDALHSMLSGLIRALHDADRDHRFRRIMFCETDDARYEELKRYCYALAPTPLFDNVELVFNEVRLPAPLVSPRLVRGIEQTAKAYLLVRAEELVPRPEDGQKPPERFLVRSSVLTVGSKATVITGVVDVAYADLERIKDKVLAHTPQLPDGLGVQVADTFLAESVRHVLATQQDSHLVVIHDTLLSQVPWEAMALANGAGALIPALGRGLTRRHAADQVSVAKWLIQRCIDDTLSVLLIVDPQSNLSGARNEGRIVAEMLGQKPRVQVTTLSQREATLEAVRAAFSSGDYDIVHFCGHGYFDSQQIANSGLHCADGVLRSRDLAELHSLPALVFFNACESGRLRKRSESADKDISNVEDAVGAAEALMRGGLANLLGTYWPVSDRAAKHFSETFYDHLLQGAPIYNALLASRKRLADDGERDWANYMFYGDPDFRIKTEPYDRIPPRTAPPGRPRPLALPVAPR